MPTAGADLYNFYFTVSQAHTEHTYSLFINILCLKGLTDKDSLSLQYNEQYC